MSILNDGNGQKLTLDLVWQNFEKYNFLLFTNMGTIDTEKYNIMEKIGQQVTYAGEHNVQLYSLFKVKGDPTRYSSIASPDGIIEKYVEIAENKTSDNYATKGVLTVDRIQIKSNRDFLKKGNKAKKLG